MNRRELIKNIALLSGGLFIGANFLLSGCKRDDAGSLVLSEDLLKLLADVSETIIPETTTAGAKTTMVAEFITKIFQDIYSEEEQKDFIAALEKINAKANGVYSKEYTALADAEKAAVIQQVKSPDDKGFLAMYQIILFSYLSSEKGLQASFRYTPVPGKFIGDIPYKKGDKMYMGLDF